MKPWCLIAVALAADTPATADPTRQLLHRSMANYEHSQKQLGDFLFDRRVQSKKFDASGEPRETNTLLVRREVIDGVPVTRTIERNGQPLSAADLAEQQKRIEKALAAFRGMTAEDKQKRLAGASVTNNREMEFLREMPEALDYRYAGSDWTKGVEVLRFEMKPRAGYKAKSMAAKVFAKVEGEIWVEKESAEMVRLDALVTDNLSLGGFLARVEKGTQFQIRRMKVEDVYLPEQIRIRFGTTVMMVKAIRQETLSDYVGYRRWRKAATN